MKLIEEKYRRLQPTIGYQTEEVVTAKSTTTSVYSTGMSIPWCWFEVF
ncbi:hypothetical protein [Amphritea sp.]|nr:hypothetical protein [Amphritea sp.]